MPHPVQSRHVTWSYNLVLCKASASQSSTAPAAAAAADRITLTPQVVQLQLLQPLGQEQALHVQGTIFAVLDRKKRQDALDSA